MLAIGIRGVSFQTGPLTAPADELHGGQGRAALEKALVGVRSGAGSNRYVRLGPWHGYRG